MSDDDGDEMNPTARMAMESFQRELEMEDHVPFDKQNHNDLDDIRSEIIELQDRIEELPDKVFGEWEPPKFVNYVHDELFGIGVRITEIEKMVASGFGSVVLVLWLVAAVLCVILWRVW